ncbi:MAG: hypothetical protein AUI50_04775 [Crenarchaeota archaeon 13_1_40CM_2_52_14]|nr:MAG: hypothetical protein AUI50_04775 [Crenarchaeota archaeon 13_1_40CM_2_52_14]OLE70061.1 MAG: hypothetical protein AUF78_08235 [archaeon 13_1_20CM_2_51_12]
MIEKMLSESSNLIAHETEIIRILKILNEATDGFVLIGGYAVNAHGQHRFSVDCELATNRDNVPVIDATLLGEGYELKRSEVRPPIGVTIREYAKPIRGETTLVLLFVDTVVSTTTRGIWTYKFIQENSVEAIVVGATGSTPSRVAQRNLLVAMKLHAGETQDFEDVVMLAERVDWKTVARCTATGSKDQLIEQIDYAIEEISSAKFASELKSIFAMRSDPTPLLKRAKLGLESLRTLVAEQKFRDSL